MIDLSINKVPSLTWHFLKMNDARIKWQNPTGGAEISAEGADSLYSAETQGEFGELSELFDSEYSRVSVSAKENEEKTARVCFDDKGESRVSVLSINAGNNSNLNVFVMLSGSGSLVLKTDTVVGDNAKVKIVFTQFTDSSGKLITDSTATVGKNSKLSEFRFFPGTVGTYAQSKVNLNGNDSQLLSNTAYLAEKSQKVDVNYVINHFGKRTSCDIAVNGVLNDNASKTFKGTIDFKCGSSGSVGTEVENVLLLGDNIVNKTLPVILCDEEDVNGNHGATIGRISDETLLYFASRGISAKDAEKLLVLSISDAFCRLVDDEITTKNIKIRTEGEIYG